MPEAEPSSLATTPRRFPWRRLVQYRLRTLVILTTIIAIWLGWWSHSARKQRDVVRALDKAGAWVRYDFENQDLKRPVFWPKWLVDGLGVDYFANVVGVNSFRSFTDDGLLLKL